MSWKIYFFLSKFMFLFLILLKEKNVSKLGKNTTNLKHSIKSYSGPGRTNRIQCMVKAWKTKS